MSKSVIIYSTNGIIEKQTHNYNISLNNAVNEIPPDAIVLKYYIECLDVIHEYIFISKDTYFISHLPQTRYKIQRATLYTDH